MWDGMAVQRLYSFEEHAQAAGRRAGFSRRIGGGPDRRLGDHPGAAACHVPQAARRSRASRHASRPRRLLPLLCAPRGVGAGAPSLAADASPRSRPDIDRRLPWRTFKLESAPRVARRARKSGTPPARRGRGKLDKHVSAGSNARNLASMSPAMARTSLSSRNLRATASPTLRCGRCSSASASRRSWPSLASWPCRVQHFDELLDETARLTAEGLRAEFCKVLEHIPDREPLPGARRRGLGSGRRRRSHASAPISLHRPASHCAPASLSSPITWRTRSASGRPRSSPSMASTAP